MGWNRWQNPLLIDRLRVLRIRPRSGGRSFLSLCPGSDYRKEGETLNLTDFANFCNEKLHLRQRVQKIQDLRKRPEIPLGSLLMLVIGGLALRRKSFHQLDLFARQSEARKWLGSSRRMVASDATCWRVLPDVAPSQLRDQIRETYQTMRRSGHGTLELPSRKKLRVGALDGSALGGRYATAFELLGAHAATIDLEPVENRGKELPGAEILLRRLFQSYGATLVDLVMGDGLYLTQRMMRLCREELNTHLLVKTTELDSLNVLKDAEALFTAPASVGREVERKEGTDLVRKLQYKIWAARGFQHDGYSGELKVARVQITPLKGPREGKTETFWVVTTDLSLSAEDMRELAHLRWSIENHGFRAMNDHMNSKHQWTRGAKAAAVFEVLMLLMMWTFLMILAYHAGLDPERLWKSRRVRKVTLGHLAECWLLSLRTAGASFALTG